MTELVYAVLPLAFPLSHSLSLPHSHLVAERIDKERWIGHFFGESVV